MAAPTNTVHDVVDITRHNFESSLPAVVKALQQCTFFAVDCEMTGLFLDNNKEDYLDEMPDRYAKMAASSSAYIVNQFGLSCFRHVSASSSRQAGAAAPGSSSAPGGSGYVATTFNFYVFPEPVEGSQQTRKFTCDAGSLSFLASQGFDFNKWVYQGVPFMPARERNRRAEQIMSSSNEPRNEVVVSKVEDIAFVEELVKRVTAWLAHSSEPVLVLPQVNSYQRLLSYQTLCKPQFGVEGHPGFFLKRVEVNGWTQLHLVRGTAEEAQAMEEADKRERLEALQRAAGFTRVLEAMRDSGRPLVGHNCMFDLAYVLGACAEPGLPPTWEGYKHLVGQWFPGGVYDTKYLSRCLPEIFQGATALGEVYAGLTQDGPARHQAQQALSALSSQAGGLQLGLPHVEHAPECRKYQQVEAGGLAHEAGYDAFMTGAAFANLLPLVRAKELVGGMPLTDPGAPAAARQAVAGPAPSGSVSEPTDMDTDPAVPQQDNPLQAVRQFNGRLNLVRSDMPYAAVTGPDPPLERPHIFHVTAPPTMNFLRVNDVVQLFQAHELGRPRITTLTPTTVLAEVDMGMAATATAKLVDRHAAAAVAAAAGGPTGAVQQAAAHQGFKVITYAEYSKARAAAAAEAAAAGERPARPQKRPRGDAQPSTAAAPASAATVAAGPGAPEGVEGLMASIKRCVVM